MIRVERRALATLCLLPALSLVCSCANSGIPVDDLGERWQGGFVDPGLLGRWRACTDPDVDQEIVYTFSDKAGRYRIDSMQGKKKQGHLEESVCRTLLVGKHRFFVMGRAENEKPKTKKKPGNLFLYTIEDDVLTFWEPKGGLLARAVEGKGVEGEVVRTQGPDGEATIVSVTLKRLDANTLAFIENLAAKRGNWNKLLQFKRHGPGMKKAAEPKRPGRYDVPQ